MSAEGGGQPDLWQPAASEKEKDFFTSVVKHLQDKPQVNWDRVATDMELKDGTIAKIRYYQIRKKLGFDSADAQASNAASFASDEGGFAEKTEGSAGEPTTPLKTPRKPRAPRKPRTPKGDGLTSPSPSKKRKSTVAKAENVAPEVKLEEDDSESTLLDYVARSGMYSSDASACDFEAQELGYLL